MIEVGLISSLLWGELTFLTTLSPPIREYGDLFPFTGSFVCLFAFGKTTSIYLTETKLFLKDKQTNQP